MRTAYEEALREQIGTGKTVGVGQAPGGSSTLKWLVIFAIAGGVAYGIYELTRPKKTGPKSERELGVHRTGGQGQFWYGTTKELDFPIGRAQGPTDARRKGYEILMKKRRYRDRLTGVYWLEGGKFAFS